MNDIDCDGTENTLVDCSFLEFGTGSCSYYGGKTIVNCALQAENGTVGELRLADMTETAFAVSGRLEVYNGVWGSVCDDYFYPEEASVACRQLGYYDKGTNSLSGEKGR